MVLSKAVDCMGAAHPLDSSLPRVSTRESGRISDHKIQFMIIESLAMPNCLLCMWEPNSNGKQAAGIFGNFYGVDEDNLVSRPKF